MLGGTSILCVKSLNFMHVDDGGSDQRSPGLFFFEEKIVSLREAMSAYVWIISVGMHYIESS